VGYFCGKLQGARHFAKDEVDCRDRNTCASPDLPVDSTGSSSWLPTPMLDLSFGTKPPGAPRTDGEILAQTSADCAVYATPGLIGCIAMADSIVTGKSFAEGLTAPFRHGPPPKESVYKAGY